MFTLDLMILNSIKSFIDSWSTVNGLFEFLKFAVIASYGATAMNDFIKIKRGDKVATKQKR